MNMNMKKKMKTASVFTAASLLVFAFAFFSEGRRGLVKGRVVAKSEIPAHSEIVDKGVLPFESRNVGAEYFLILSSGGTTEKIAVRREVYENAAIGDEITLRRR